tara:strand:- start:22389 stop:23264 length:876 start_codon:yes stop_codon:yes gene_type:complete
MSNLDLCAQILFKKYGDEFPWLNYTDLTKIIQKFANDPIYQINNGELSVEKVKIIHSKVYPVIEKIERIKCFRNLDNEENENENENLAKKVDLKNSIPKRDLEEIIPIVNYKTHHVLIDSKDRNKDIWSKNNPFQFSLGQSSVNLSSLDQPNTVYRSFSDVHSITIKKIIIPYTNISVPYLLLTVNELGSNIIGTNDIMNNSFGHLTNPIIVGNYAHFVYNENFESIVQTGQESHMTKIFSPRIELSRLTFDIKKPDGTIVDFENDDSVVFELQITCLRKELENTMLVRRS